jgi:hypothetical protein
MCACVCVCLSLSLSLSLYVFRVDNNYNKKKVKETKGDKRRQNDKSIRGGDRTPDLERVKLTS